MSLYPSLTLEFSDTSSRHFIDTVQNLSVSRDVRDLVVYTHPDPDLDIASVWGATSEDRLKTPDVPDCFREALRHVIDLPALKSFDLRFTKECAREYSVSLTRGFFPREVPETEDYRVAMLGRVFNVLDNLVTAGRPIESLAIKNLQNTKIPSITSSAEFKAVMANLKQLHLSICTEHDEASPEASIERPEYMDFPVSLSMDWFAPVCDQLTHLSLYQDVFFGLLPMSPNFRIDRFPKLKSLTLGNHVIGYDMPLEWILSHASTLEELILDENAIVHYIGVIQEDEIEKFHIDTRFVDRVPHITDVRILFKYNKRWHDIFDALREGLPYLRNFYFGSHMHARTTAINLHEVEMQDQFETELFPGRYVVFDSGIGPTQWLAPEEDGSYPDAFYGSGLKITSPDNECHNEDQNALDRLLETVEVRNAERSVA